MASAARNDQSTVKPVPVPPLNLAAGFAAIRDEALAELTAVAESGYYVLGPKVSAFEEALARYCGVQHALGVSSGTDALLAALMALGIGAGDEVIVPTFTFFATAGCVARLGARPVFCDIEPRTFNIDVARVDRLITPRTKAVMPVHLYGQLAEMKPLLELAERHDLAVIEDAAQAIGSKAHGVGGGMAGSFGTCGCLSFYPTKNLGALGDAGALLTNDDQLIDTARQIRIHGSGHTYYHRVIGGNFRIDALQAALLTIKLKHLEEWTEQRRARAARYTELLQAAGLTPDPLQPPYEGNSRHVYHQYVLRASRRDELAAYLKERSIGCGVYYPLCLHQQECFGHLGYQPGAFPHGEAAAAQVLALPIYPELTELQQQAVVDAIVAFYARSV
ncbi:MAG: DegT/DnrJ/EryC1/StrS family aminotransferase [Planctomycetes bacterium]|nr:DegT/DnrJ/EryC1/StrS family aminotransferase [Planctomycetota bacterium]